MSGPQCCSNPPIINRSCGSDSAEKYGGLNVYVTGSPNAKIAILLISDVFGYGAPNLRKLAGKVAASGVCVVVPDFFYGDPFVYDNNRPLAVWLEDHGTDKGFEDAKSVIDALKGKGFSAIGAAGFCWGAKVVTELAKEFEFIQAAVLLHPSFIALDDIEVIREVMSGPQCCSNPPIINRSCSSDSAEKYGGLNVYVTGSPNAKIAILLISDVFGYGAPNLRKLAGKVAASGFCVVVPDFFYGDPFVYDNNRPLAVWLEDHGTDKGFEDAKYVIDALKGKGFSAIGAAGFCWGGVKAPMAVLGAEIDNYSPPELLKQFEEILNAKPEVDSYVKIFPKVSHGWSVRYNVDDEAALKRAGEAHNDMLEWFAKHVK